MVVHEFVAVEDVDRIRTRIAADLDDDHAGVVRQERDLPRRHELWIEQRGDRVARVRAADAIAHEGEIEIVGHRLRRHGESERRGPGRRIIRRMRVFPVSTARQCDQDRENDEQGEAGATHDPLRETGRARGSEGHRG